MNLFKRTIDFKFWDLSVVRKWNIFIEKSEYFHWKDDEWWVKDMQFSHGDAFFLDSRHPISFRLSHLKNNLTTYLYKTRWLRSGDLDKLLFRTARFSLAF